MNSPVALERHQRECPHGNPPRLSDRDRTTRRVAPTEAGERLIGSVGPRIAEIQRELDGLSELREKPSGTIRLTASEHTAESILWPAVARLVNDYPDIKVEIVIDDGLTDIVGERFDAGVRPGETVAKDMIAIPRSARSCGWLSQARLPILRGNPAAEDAAGLDRPQLHQSAAAIHGGLYAWEFEKKGRELNVRVDGQLIFNTASLMSKAALDGHGLVYLTEGQVAPYLADGRLARVLADWCEPFSGYHLYLPEPTPAVALLVEALRYRR